MQSISLYFHIPFCLHRCGYCDFNTYAGVGNLIPAYSQAVCRELELLASEANNRVPIHTVYFGGGTPSLMPIGDIEKILSTIDKHYQLLHTAEISLEANPGTVSVDYLNRLHSLGVNRLSIGMQSANNNELVLLERQHSYRDVVNAVEWSRVAGITNKNLDLIFGLPDQEMGSWMFSLEAALSLYPEHISLYALTLEEGTPMQHKVEAGVLPEPDPDMAAEMYEIASSQLLAAGYFQYEISNWARLDESGELYSCRHNLQYWRNLPYLGIGAGAHGYINHQRTVNVATPWVYINKLDGGSSVTDNIYTYPQTPATLHVDAIDTETEIGETMMMGLRLLMEGVSNRLFHQRFGDSLQQRFNRQIDYLIKLGLLEWCGEEDDILRITNQGRLLGNQVFREFI